LNDEIDVTQKVFELADDFGPEKVLFIYEPKTKLKAVVVVDNVATGPTIGGTRMAVDVTVEEVRRLARAMTYKNAMAYLPHGGGKSGIIADPKASNKEHLLRTFAKAIRTLKEYVPGPDMGTDEVCMAYVYDEIGRAVGLPRELGGIPLDEIGATAFGLVESIDVASGFIGMDLNEAKVTIEGFGNVGRSTAKFLQERGAILIAASDSKGTIYNPKGLDVRELIQLKSEHKSVTQYPEGQVLPGEAIISIQTDIFVPAARPDVINKENVNKVNARLIAQGANIPLTEDAEKILHERGVLSLPDFVVNAGGVITASVEYHGGTETQALDRVKSTLRKNTKEMLELVYDEKMYPREAALQIAKSRVRRAMQYREGM
jgi:glutamate dehydrogenase/leucine dehydrogenase